MNEHQKCLFSLDVPSPRKLNTTMVNKRGSEKKKKKQQQKTPGCFLLMLPTSMVPIISAFRRFQKNLHGHQTSSRILPRSTQVTVEDPGMDAAKSSMKENKTTVKSNQFLRDQCCDWVGWVGWVGWGIFVSLISC